ncbi:MAG: hypothetical protein II114_06510 [Treponema sp.]|nr:hypothetical protein [Treponema sp.]
MDSWVEICASDVNPCGNQLKYAFFGAFFEKSLESLLQMDDFYWTSRLIFCYYITHIE